MSDLLLKIGSDSHSLSQAPYLAPGAQRDFMIGLEDFKGVSAPEFICVNSVAGHAVNRHSGEVSRIAQFRIRQSGHPRYLLVYLTADGLITDVDLADD